MTDEGYIRFQCDWSKTDPIADAEVEELSYWRNKIRETGLIGVTAEGVVFGNVSVRLNNSNTFIISGTQTSAVPSLSGAYCAKVTSYNFEENSLACEGPVKASSESLSHAAVYETDCNIHAVIHVHHLEMWRELREGVPTTSDFAEYGTVDMVNEIKRLFQETDVRAKKLIVMGGHREGLLSFGSTLAEAGEILLRAWRDVVG